MAQEINHAQTKKISRQSGWGYVVGNNASVTPTTVTFPVAFPSTPRVFIVTINGYRLVASGVPTGAASASSDVGSYAAGSPASATTANVNIVTRDAASTHGTNAYLIFSWIAEM